MKRVRLNPKPFNYEHIQDRNFSRTRTHAIVHAHSSENSSSLSSEKTYSGDLVEYSLEYSGSCYGKNLMLQMFEYFWSLYPRKVDKGKTLHAWKKLCNKKDRPSWPVIKEAIEAQKESQRWQDKQFIPHPTTWINQERWLDNPKEMISSAWVTTDKEQKPPKVMEDGMWWFLENDGSYYNRQGQRLS
jgi:hypothetical protein